MNFALFTRELNIFLSDNILHSIPNLILFITCDFTISASNLLLIIGLVASK